MARKVQTFFVDDLGAQLFRLRHLRAGIGAGHDVVGLLRDRVGHLAPRALDQRRRLLAGQVGKGAGEDNCLALQRPPGDAPLGGVLLELQALGAQLLDQLHGALVGERLGYLLRHHRADALDLLDLLRIGRPQRVDRAEVIDQRLGGHVADPGQAEREQDPLEGP